MELKVWDEIRDKLKEVDISPLTPLEALNILQFLKTKSENFNSLSGSVKGVLFACSSALGVTLVYLCSRLLAATMTNELLLFWWFALASVWSAAALAIKRKTAAGFGRVIRSHFRFFGLYMLLECAATVSFFFVIRFVNPSIVSFFDILSPLFVTIIAFFYLKEKLKKIEILGGIVSLCGVAVLT